MDACYKEMYYHLFNRITDALKQLDGQNVGLAIELLKNAQQETEEMFIGAEDLDKARE